MAEFDVDLFVIGGGSGGVRAARIAAGHGARVMLAEEFRVGGTCVIRGCVPKKLYVYAARFADAFEDAAGYGWTVPPARFDWKTLVDAKEREITRLEGAYLRTQENAGVTVVRSRAVLEDAHTVRLLADGRRVRAKHILIATGGRPNLPELPGIEHAVTSNEVFDLQTFPRRILIAGGGYIAVEFAGLFAGLGSEVTLIYRGDGILRGFDEDVREALRVAYEKRGIRFIFNDVIERIDSASQALDSEVEPVDSASQRVESTSQSVESGSERSRLSIRTRSGQEIAADAVLFAIGRSPNTAGLGLETAGVTLDREGAIKVDMASQTSQPNIYAVGDVTNRVNLTPVAIREGHAVADSVFGGKPWVVDHANIPTAVFSTPEIGTVGLTEAQARAQFAVVDVYKTSFRPMKAVLAGRDERMLMKIIVDGVSDRVLGVHILGEGAGEMAQLLGIAVRMKATKADFDHTMALHPTSAEELVTMRTRAARYERADAA